MRPALPLTVLALLFTVLGVALTRPVSAQAPQPTPPVAAIIDDCAAVGLLSHEAHPARPEVTLVRIENRGDHAVRLRLTADAALGASVTLRPRESGAFPARLGAGAPRIVACARL